MSFAIPFSKSFKYPNQDIQWNINYKPKIKQLDNFISNYGTHRINLIITNPEFHNDYEIIQALREKFPTTQLVVCFPQYHKDLEQELSKQGLPHYYNEVITDLDKFQGFLKLNVTDIIIGGVLAFNAKILSLYAKKYNKSLRTFCNICETSWEDTPSLKTFFIRPQDIDLYQKYIDTFQFFIDTNSPIKINTLYEIYTKDKYWFGKLNELIIGYKGQQDSRYIIPMFGVKRLNCGKRCYLQQQSSLSCHICDKIIELSKTLKDKSLMVTVDKNKNL